MHPTFRRLGTSELLPRYIFAESLFARRRVLEVDAVATTGGESARFLLERGARMVVSCDADLAAVAAAQKAHGGPTLRFRANIYDDLEPGSFDLVLVADLAPYVRAPTLLAELARLVNRQGYLLGGLRNTAGLALWQLMDVEEGVPPTYGQLLDALSPHFLKVEVATQCPVLGYQLAFESGDGLQVDGTLIRGSEAAYFVVVAGQEPARIVDPTWVQLPPEPLAFTRGKLDEVAQRSKSWEERAGRLKESLTRVRAELTDRENEVAQLKPALEGARDDVARLTAQLEQARGTPESTRERDELSSRLRRTELELQVALERVTDADRRLSQQRLELEAAERARREAEVQALGAQEAVRLERARREELNTTLEESRERLTQAYTQLRELRDELAGLRMEREKDRLAAERSREQFEELRRQVEAARERELRLAEQYSTALAAVEHLKADVARADEARGAAEESLRLRDGDLARVSREVEDSARRVSAAEAGRREAEVRLTAREAEWRGLETELTAARAEVERLSAEVEARSRAEAHARATGVKLEQALHEARARLEAQDQERESAAAELTAALTEEHRLAEEQLEQVVAEALARAEAAAAEAARERAAREAQERRAEGLEHQLRVEEGAREEASRALIELEVQQQTWADERGALRRRVVEVEATLTELERVRASDVESIARLDAALKATQGSIAAEQAERARTDEAREQALAELELERRERARLEERLKQSEARLAEALEREESISTEREARKRDAVEARVELDGLQDDLELSRLQAQQASLALQRAQQTLSDRDLQLSRLQKELEEARTRLAAEHEQAELLTLQLESARRIAGKAPSLESALQEERAALEAARAELEAAKAKRAELESKVEEAERLAREGEASVRGMREQLTVLEEDKAGLVSEREQLGAELTVARAARIRLEGRVSALEVASAEAVEFLDTERAERAKQTEAAEALRARLQTLEGERAALREKVRQLEAREPLADSDAVLELSAEVERLQGQCEELQATLAERDAALTELRRRLESQEGELALLKRLSARAGANTVQDIYARANAELNAVKNELLRRPKGGTPAQTPAGPAAPEAAAPSAPKPDDPG